MKVSKCCEEVVYQFRYGYDKKVQGKCPSCGRWVEVKDPKKEGG